MKKATRIIFAILFAAVIAFTLAACTGKSDIVYADIESITVDEASVSGVFLISEFDISQVNLKVKYIDTTDEGGNTVPGETVDMPATMSMVKAEDKAKLSVPGTKDITLIYGKFEIVVTLTLTDDTVRKYKVTFLDEDGRTVGDPQFIDEGGRAVAPALATVPDKDFIGWKDRDNDTMSSYDNIQKDLILVAVYAPKAYKVTFKYRLNGQEIQIGNPVMVPRGGDAREYAPAFPALTGHSNPSWEDEGSMANINAEMVFYAKYDRDQVQIGFTYLRYSEAMTTYYFAYDVNGEILNPPVADYPGYKFVEWQLNGKKVDFPFTVTMETTFTAKYIDINVGNAGLSYALTAGDYLEVSGYDGSDTAVVIPEQALYNGIMRDVREVRDGAFKGCADITEFVVSNTNKYFITIDGVLFTYPVKQEATIDGHKVTVSKQDLVAYPASKTSEGYVLPETVACIHPYAFYGSAVSAVTLNEGLITIGDYAFAECRRLGEMVIPTTVTTLGEGVLSISTPGSLDNLDLTQAVSLTTIGDGAFSGLADIGSIYIPAALNSLGNGVFTGCKALEEVRVAPDNDSFVISGGVLYSADKTSLYLYPAMFAGNANAFLDVDIACNRIVEGAFDGVSLDSVYLRSNISLDKLAFNSPNIRYIKIYDNSVNAAVDSFGDYVPMLYLNEGNGSVSALESLFGARVQVLDDDLPNVRIYVPADVADTIFTYETDTYTDGTLSLGVRILGVRTHSDYVEIPDAIGEYKVVWIAPYAFAEHNFIREAELPAQLREIGTKAFYKMRGLRRIRFKGTVLKVGDEAFAENPYFDEISYSETLDNITEFGIDVFRNTAYLNDNSSDFVGLGNILVKFTGFSEDVRVPEQYTYIAPDAFKGHGEITSITFGSELKRISQYAFQTCTGLSKISFPATLATIEADAFSGCDNLLVVDYKTNDTDGVLTVDGAAYPAGVKQIYLNTKTFMLTYYIDANAEYNEYGLVFIEPYTDIVKANVSFAGWYYDVALTEMVEFPFDPYDRFISNDSYATTVYPKFVGVGASSEGLVYRLTDSGDYAITGYEGHDAYLIVPKMYKGKYVREIDDGAFKNKSFIRFIELPTDKLEGTSEKISALNFIGEDAFTGTAWYDNIFGDFITINDFLIKYNGDAEEVVIPDGITKIAKGAFKGNNKLRRVVISDSVNILDDGVFYGCSKLKEVKLSDNLIQIGSETFKNCTSLENIDFADTKLTSVAKDAFDGTPWFEEYPGDCVMIKDILYKYKGKATKLHVYNGVGTIGESAFENNLQLIDIYLPQSVTMIRNSAFRNSNISSVYLYAGGSDLTIIEDYAFCDCKYLSEIDLKLAQRLVTIGKGAFEGCTALQELNIPASVAMLGESAFEGSRLKTVVFSSGSKLMTISKRAFYECRSLFSVNFQGASALTLIDDYAFYNCTGLRDFIDANGSVARLGVGAFYNCSQLVNFNINDNALREIGDDALKDVGYVRSDNSNMVVLGNILVEYKGYDTEVTIPAHITTIYNGAFAGNRKLTKINFPANSAILNINAYAFYGCDGLSEINFPDTIQYVGTDAVRGTKWFEDKERNGEEFIIIANTLVKYNGVTVKQVVIPESVGIIASDAFVGTSVYDILIGDNVTKIEDNAFRGIEYVTATGDPMWTITILNPVPPVIGTSGGIYTDKILMPSSEVMETYRLDDNWVMFYDKMSVAVKHTVHFHTDSTLSDAIGDKELYALYAPVEVEMLPVEEGEEVFMFVGWYRDEGGLYPVSYPFLIDSELTLYAKYISEDVGTDPGVFTIYKDNGIDGTTVNLYSGQHDNTVIIIKSLSGVDMTAIGQGFVRDDEYGTYIMEDGEYKYSETAVGVKYTKVGAFEDHNEITEIYFATGSQITTIGADAFKNCKGLKKIVLPACVKVIEEGAFEGCYSLESVEFAEDCTELRIMGGAFRNCLSLRSVRLPAGLSFLGDGAFEGCVNLVDVYVSNKTAIRLDDDDDNEFLPFEYNVGLRIHIPAKSYNSYAEYWKHYAEYLVEEHTEDEIA